MTLRLGGPASVGPEERAETLVVVGGDAEVDGAVTDTLVVVGGRARVAGRVVGDVLVIGGALTLGPRAHVQGDVSLVRSSFDPAPGAEVRGVVHRSGSTWPGWRFRLLLWTAMSAAVLGLLLLGRALARETLEGGVRALVEHLGGSVVAALVVWVGVPVASVLAMLTIVGIPVALVTLLFALPALWLLGYASAGLVLGSELLRTLGRRERARSANSSVVLGVAFLQLVALVPVIGLPLVLIAGHLGAGALVYHAWRRRRGAETATVSLSSTQPAIAPEPSR